MGTLSSQVAACLVSGSVFRVSVSGIEGFGMSASCFEIRASSFWFRISGVCFLVSCFRFRLFSAGSYTDFLNSGQVFWLPQV